MKKVKRDEKKYAAKKFFMYLEPEMIDAVKSLAADYYRTVSSDRPNYSGMARLLLREGIDRIESLKPKTVERMVERQREQDSARRRDA